MIIDIHSHLLPNVDDGPTNIETSLEMLKIGVNEGTSHMVLTPHYVQGYYENSKETISSRIRNLQQLADQANLNIKLYCGNEIHINDQLLKLIDEGNIFSLNNSRYLLIEFPMLEVPYYSDEILFRIMLKGFVPIIAHPERNMVICDNIQIVSDLVERGVLIQINGESINGGYGKKIAKVSYEMMKQGLVSFIASDAHSNTSKTPGLSKARNNIIDAFDLKLANKLLNENPMKVILNETID